MYKRQGGALAGIFFEVIIMRVTLEIFRDLPILSVSAVSKLSGGFFDGLNMWEQCLAAAFVYIGVFFAAMQGDVYKRQLFELLYSKNGMVLGRCKGVVVCLSYLK